MKQLNAKMSVLAAAILVSACGSVGKDYQRPNFDTPASIGQINSNKPVSTVNFKQWWKSFHDPVLDKLLDEADANSQDLKLAVARMAEAKATFDAGASNHYPIVDGTFSDVRNRYSRTGSRLGIPSASIYSLYNIGINASYEIDFWGKFARADEANKARLLAQSANRDLAQSALYASIAQTYFALRAADGQLRLAQDALKFRQENFNLQKRRFDAGSIGALDLHQAESEVLSAEVAVAQAKQTVALNETSLAVLVGRSPAAITQGAIPRGKSIDELYQELQLPADLPSDLLSRRPDLAAAEQTLIAANAEIGQVKAQYFPSIRLTAGTGYESRALRDLFDPISWFWNLGSSITQPLFRAGAIGAAVAGAEARQQSALAQYSKAVQEAFRDVHDALTNSEANDQIHIATEQRVKALKDSWRLADLRYKNGYSAYLEVLSAQRDVLQAEGSLIETKRAHLAALIGVYKAIGGGWEKTPEFTQR